MITNIQTAALAAVVIAIVAGLAFTPIGNYVVAMVGGSIQYGHL